jgi:DNA-directed RNA polymerase subunit M/transcription elongation factor TFIIS
MMAQLKSNIGKKICYLCKKYYKMKEKIIELYKALTKPEKDSVLKVLQIISNELQINENIEKCPHCNSMKVIKYGTHKGERR